MKNQLLFSILLLMVILSSCNSSNTNSSEPENKTVIIAGKVHNYNQDIHKYTIKVYDQGIVSEGKYHTTILEDDGSFEIKFNKEYTSDFFLEYVSRTFLLGGPGDSIYIELSTSGVVNPEDTNPKTYRVFGSNQKENEEINKYESLFDKCYSYSEQVTLKSEEYLEFLKDRRSKERKILDSLKQIESLSEKYIQWKEISIDYQYAGDLFHYCWYNPFVNNKGIEKYEIIDIPDSFYKAIKDIPLNNEEALISSSYLNFLHEYYCSTTNTLEFFKKGAQSRGYHKTQEYKEDKKKNLLKIDQGFKGIAREILLSQRFYGFLEGKNIDLYEELYPKYKDQIRQSSREILEEKYSELKLKMEKPKTQASLYKNGKKPVAMKSDILDDIITKNKGKVVYVDFWAIWCGPCLSEFPNSKKLHKTLDTDDVEFVYLCVKSKKEDWETKMAEYNLEGSHYLLNDSQYDILSAKFNISGIPHYVLIDKEGNIVDDKAPRPGSGEEIRVLLEKYMNL